MEIERKYQTFWPRFWAGLVDGIFFMPLRLVRREIYADVIPKWVRIIWYILDSFAFAAYVVVMHARFGQTLGKMVTHVRVLDLSEAKLSARQAFLRELVPLCLTALFLPTGLGIVLAGKNPTDAHQYRAMAPAFWLWFAAGLGWFAAELITMLTNSKRRAVHDFIASSVVLRESKTVVREFRGVV